MGVVGARMGDLIKETAKARTRFELKDQADRAPFVGSASKRTASIK